MRTTIVIPDGLATEIRRRAGAMTFSEFTRIALAERIERIDREEQARAMSEGYAAEAERQSLDGAWTSTEVEGWE